MISFSRQSTCLLRSWLLILAKLSQASAEVSSDSIVWHSSLALASCLVMLATSMVSNSLELLNRWIYDYFSTISMHSRFIYNYLPFTAFSISYFRASNYSICEWQQVSSSMRLPLPDFMAPTNSRKLSRLTVSRSSSTCSPYRFSTCSKLLHSSVLTMSNSLRQQAQIYSPALKMQSLSYGKMEGKNYVKMSTMSSKMSQHRLVIFRLVDLRLQFYAISCSIYAKYIYSINLDYSLTDDIQQTNNLLVAITILCINLFLLLHARHILIFAQMRHNYSKSTHTLPRSRITSQQPSNKGENQGKTTKLPNIGHGRSFSNLTLSHLSKAKKDNTATKRSEIIKSKQPEPQQVQLISSIREKADLLSVLKKNILECSDNVFLKKLLSEIRFTSIGKVALEMWHNVQSFQNCDLKLLDEIEQKYQFKITEDSAKTMDFINNVCRFMLADYKKKRWLHYEKKVSDKFCQIDATMNEVGRKIQGIENNQTKMQILLSLAGIKQECYAKKSCYVNWKERAVQKLKQNQIKCELLRAEIFTQGFF